MDTTYPLLAALWVALGTFFLWLGTPSRYLSAVRLPTNIRFGGCLCLGVGIVGSACLLAVVAFYLLLHSPSVRTAVTLVRSPLAVSGPTFAAVGALLIWRFGRTPRRSHPPPTHRYIVGSGFRPPGAPGRQ